MPQASMWASVVRKLAPKESISGEIGECELGYHIFRELGYHIHAD